MAATTRQRAKGRGGSTFLALPHTLFRASGGKPPPAAMLSEAARALLIDVARQFNGTNNGNLSAAPKIMVPYGWHSRGMLNDALVECVAQGFLELTRQGGRNRCSLFALTWLGIDEGPHDARRNPVPSQLWKPEHEERRDPLFLRRWQQILKRRGKITHPSRYSDKASRAADKSTRANGPM